jgi:glycosyltransferase involved in cell wall biosynthesis
MMQKNNNPILSIVTPSYNQERFIDETIKSVISQEGDFNIDYIIIDGKSTDGSVEIIKKYDTLLKQGKWPVKCKGINYRWVSEPDDGQSDAIAKGFRMAEGDVLAWLNSDDVYMPDAFKKVIGFYDSHLNIMMMYGDTYFIDESGSAIGKYPTEAFEYKRLAVSNYIGQPSAFFRKKAYEEAGGVDIDLQYVMDYDLWIRMARRFNIEHFPEFLSSFRLHEESKTISREQAYANMKEMLNIIIKHYCWAPINRVYGYSYCLVKEKMPSAITFKPIDILIAIAVSIFRYLSLNKGIRVDDMKMINMQNIKKLSKSWLEISKGI